MFRNSVSFSDSVILLLSTFFLVALVTANPVLTIIALSFPPLAAKLVWKKNEPPILFLGLLLQWLQVSIKVFYADILDVPFASVNTFKEHIVESFLYCNLALLVEALGMHIVTRKLVFTPLALGKMRVLIDRYSLLRITLVYVLFSLSMPFILRYGPGNAGIQQFLVKLADFKWSIFFLFYCLTFTKQENKFTFYVIVIIEIIIGFAGYFSNFKDSFLCLAICYLVVKRHMKLGQYISFGIVTLILLNVMIIWSSVKSDYRNYLSGGQRAQIITVSTRQALNVLYYRIKSVNANDYRNGLKQLINRISYIDFFSAVMNYVPERLPYENGRLWRDAVLRIFTPRILFPNKAVIDDSERTRKYTGLSYAGAEAGTSISLGYITESYVDFGPAGMFIPLFFLGMLIGKVYLYIVQNTYNRLLGMACAVPIFFQTYTFELALDKVIGAMFAFFLVYLMVRKFFVPPVHRYLTSGSELAAHAPAPDHGLV